MYPVRVMTCVTTAGKKFAPSAAAKTDGVVPASKNTRTCWSNTLSLFTDGAKKVELAVWSLLTKKIETLGVPSNCRTPETCWMTRRLPLGTFEKLKVHSDPPPQSVNVGRTLLW